MIYVCMYVCMLIILNFMVLTLTIALNQIIFQINTYFSPLCSLNQGAPSCVILRTISIHFVYVCVSS